MLFVAVLAALLMGFLAGLWSVKIKSRWCPRCGATTNELIHELAGHAR
jgi:hypothetical protein